MSNDPILHLLGMAKKAGRLEVGEEPVGAACRARQARLVLLAAVAAPNTPRRAAHSLEILVHQGGKAALLRLEAIGVEVRDVVAVDRQALELLMGPHGRDEKGLIHRLPP